MHILYYYFLLTLTLANMLKLITYSYSYKLSYSVLTVSFFYILEVLRSMCFRIQVILKKSSQIEIEEREATVKVGTVARLGYIRLWLLPMLISFCIVCLIEKLSVRIQF